MSVRLATHHLERLPSVPIIQMEQRVVTQKGQRAGIHSPENFTIRVELDSTLVLHDRDSHGLGEGDARTLVTRRRIARLLVIMGQLPEAIAELLRIVELHARENRLDDVDCTEAMEEVFRIVHECRNSPPRSDTAVLDVSATLSALINYRHGLSAGTARERIDQWIAAFGDSADDQRW